jgi:hypothetical protein
MIEEGSFEARGGARRRNWPYWEQDNDQCSHAATHSAYLSTRLPDSVIAGTHVVGYSGRDNLGFDYKIYFAPSIGCQELSFQMIRNNALGRQTYEYSRIVDSYDLGAPDTNLFKIPEGFRQVEFFLESR